MWHLVNTSAPCLVFALKLGVFASDYEFAWKAGRAGEAEVEEALSIVGKLLKLITTYFYV